MAGTTDIHDPDLGLPAHDLPQEQVGEEKVADVIYSKLLFHSLWRGRVRCRHDACVVDKMVKALWIVIHLRSCPANAFLRAQI